MRSSNDKATWTGVLGWRRSPNFTGGRLTQRSLWATTRSTAAGVESRTTMPTTSTSLARGFWRSAWINRGSGSLANTATRDRGNSAGQAYSFADLEIGKSFLETILGRHAKRHRETHVRRDPKLLLPKQ